MSYYGNDMLEMMKYQSQDQNNKVIFASTGEITSVDLGTPEHPKYLAKVMLQPGGTETGWLPIGSLYTGKGFGMWAVPDIGTEVTVVFEMGNINCGKIICCNFNDTDTPPHLNPGEAAFIHKSGISLKFNNDGTVELGGNTASIARVGDSVQVNVPGIGECTGTITTGSNKVKAG